MTTPDLTTTDERRALAFALTGEQPARNVALELSTLRKQGILIDLNIRGTRMFQRTLSWAETGIADFGDDPRIKKYTRGQKFLFPEDEVREIKSIEASMRNDMKKFTYEVSGFAPYRFLPFTAYAAWRAKWDAQLARWNEIKARMVANQGAYAATLANEYAVIAEAAWQSITQNQYAYVIVETKHERKTLDHTQFVEYVVANTVSQIPTAEDIEARLRADYVTALAYGQEDVAADEAAAARVREQITLEREFNQAEVSAAQEAVRKQAWDNQADQRERELKLEAMLQAEAEHARQQLRETVSPFAEIFSAMRAQMAKSATEILESVQKFGFVRGNVAEKGRGLIEFFKLMAVKDDIELREQLYLLDKQLAPASEARNVEDIKATLAEIVNLEALAAADLSAGPNKFSLLEM